MAAGFGIVEVQRVEALPHAVEHVDRVAAGKGVEPVFLVQAQVSVQSAEGVSALAELPQQIAAAVQICRGLLLAELDIIVPGLFLLLQRRQAGGAPAGASSGGQLPGELREEACVLVRKAETGIEPAPGGQIIRLVLKGEIEGEAVGPVLKRPVVAHHLVHRQAQGRRLLRVLLLHLIRQVAQVDQIVIGGGGKAAEGQGPASHPGKLRVVAPGKLCAHHGEEPVQRPLQRLRLAQIQAGQGQPVQKGIAGELLLAAGRVAVHDHVAGLPAVQRAALQLGQESVIPAAAGDDLLGGDHVLGVIAQAPGQLRRGHHAGVKAHEAQLVVFAEGAGLQSLHQLRQGQAVPVKLVRPEAAHGPAAVIPEDQAVAFGRVVGRAEVQKGAQGLRRAHAGRGRGGDPVQAPL